MAKKKYQTGGLISYNPNLAAKDQAFQQWYSLNTPEGKHGIPFSDQLDYDYYSAFRNNDIGQSSNAHFTDRYKRPNHPTFSDESMYSVPENPGGHWEGDKFTKQKHIPMGKSGIHINPKNKGKFNATKKATGKSTEELTHSSNPVTKKRAVFAQNAAKWHHAQDGMNFNEIPGKSGLNANASAPRLIPYEEQQSMNMQMRPNMVQYGMDNSGVSPDYEQDQTMGINPNSGVPNTGNYVAQRNSQMHGNHQRQPYNGEAGKAALAGLLAVDAFIPGRKQPSFVNRPGLSYNEHPYGTGSSALAKDGITISQSGYKSNSPDRFHSSLRIPSNNITMKGVNHPVYGRDNLGNGKMMFPGEDHQFAGNYVDEYPIMQQGGNVPAYQNYDQIQHDNDFARQFVARKGAPGWLAQNTVVARNIGDPKVQFQYKGAQQPATVKPAYTLPTGVTSDDIFQTNEGQYGYYNNDSNFTPVDAATIYSMYGHKPKPLIPQSSSSTASLKSGGRVRVYKQGGMLQNYYEKGGTYDVSDEEIKQLAAAGYKMKYC